MLLWVSCRQVQVSSEPKTDGGSYTKLGIPFGDPVLSLLPDHFLTHRGPSSQFLDLPSVPLDGETGFLSQSSQLMQPNSSHMGPLLRTETTRGEKRPGNPSPDRFLFQVVPPLHHLVLFRVLGQSSVFCHEFLVVTSGRDGQE